MKIKPLAKNRKARFEYDIQKTFEAGIVLKVQKLKASDQDKLISQKVTAE